MPEESGPALRACIVGAGLMGRWHAASVAAVGGTIVSVVDPDPLSLETMVGRHHGARGFSSLDMALQSLPPDVVHLCTPLSSHAELATVAMNCGAHVVIEKPLARNAEETGALLELAQSRNLLLAPVHQFVFQRGVAEALKRLPSLGDIQHLSFEICSAGGEQRSENLLDQIVDEILPHPISVAEAFGLGAEQGSTAVLSPRAGELSAMWNCAGGATVSVLVSMHGRPPRNRATLVSSRATIHFDFFHGFSFTERAWTSRWRKAASPFEHSGRTVLAGSANLLERAWRSESAYPGLRELIGQFYAAVREHGPSPIPPQSVLAVALARDHLLQRAAEARASR
ncbi:MAG: Gfo/Idh/MocA family oxidoreductase [Acidobacteriota bacterium]